MASNRQLSRIAGLLYLVVVLTGMFSLAYVPKQLFFWDDPAKTFDTIVRKESLFRWSIASSVICYTAFLFLSLALFHLLKATNEFYARLMVILVLISLPISFINLQHKYGVLDLVRAFKQMNAQGAMEFQKQAMNYLSQYDNGIVVSTIFWGLWLLPFGYLVFRSGLIPKVFGVLLILGGVGYLVNYFGNTLLAEYSSLGISGYLGLLPAMGEIGTCLWLLMVGARNRI